MSFDDLPPNWPDLPLDTPALALDVIDLLVGVRDRAQNTLLLLPCDIRGVSSRHPISIADMDWHCPTAYRRKVFETFCEVPVAAWLVAVSSPDGLAPGLAKRWLRTARTSLSEHGKRLLGVYEATLDGVTEVREDPIPVG